MTEILLEEWAAQNHIATRTAQHWAQKGRIPAKLKKTLMRVERTMKKYFIDSEAQPPA